MFQAQQSTPIMGCYLLAPHVRDDSRGSFIKSYHSSYYELNDMPFQPAEEFYTKSVKDVIRGMHFQMPPHDHEKTVTCLKGSILDVVLDMRKESPTFGQYAHFELSESNHLILYMPKGIAHGYLCLEDSLVLYNTTTVFNEASDYGIHWNSFGFSWPVDNPIVSDKDQSLPKFNAFDNPF